MEKSLEVKEFGSQLRKLRMEAGMSVRCLAEKAGVSFALLTCIENAKRGAGRSTLERLGSALGLKGASLDDFILDGIVICKRELVLESAEGYPARVLNALPMALRRSGVVPEVVEACEVNSSAWERKARQSDADLVLRLKDGSKVSVTFKFTNE